MNKYYKYLLFLIYLIKILFDLKTLKTNNILGFREALSKKNGIDLVDINSIIDWNKVSLNLKYLPHGEGHVSILELSILAAYVRKLDSNQNFLEIGTFEGITSFNCALNAENINIYTLDLPYEQSADDFHTRGYLDYDITLISSPKRKNNILQNVDNVIRLFGDSTSYDFSTIEFSMAFIDGGHDYKTVKSDSLNILRHIIKPGWIFWHDYDVTNDVGKCLHEISNKININWIKNTRLCFSYVEHDFNI